MDDARIDALEARLRHLEDLAEIHQLFIDYGTFLDAGDFDSYSKLFASDGVVRLGPMGTATGPTEIKALMASTLADSVGSTFHIISSPVVTLDGDAARSRVMWTVITRDTEGAPTVMSIGSHRDELVREDGHWRIKSRRGFIDIPGAPRGPKRDGGTT
jgi:3-phenylpropionate/cinnamic acid dioxygenase small subunit